MNNLWPTHFRPEAVRAGNQLLGTQELPLLTWGEEPWVPENCTLGGQRLSTELLAIQCGIWGGRLGLGPTGAWAPFDHVAWDTVSDALRIVATNVMLRPILDWIESLCGETVHHHPESIATATDQRSTITFGFRPRDLAINDRTPASRSIHLELDEGAWAAIAARVSLQPTKRLGLHLPLALRVMVGLQHYGHADLEQVRPGDLMRLTKPSHVSEAVTSGHLALGDSILFECRFSNGQTIVERPASTAPGSLLMNKDNSVKNLEQLQLPVSFVLGSIPVTLQELQKIGPGHSFSTNLSTEHPVVTILVDGQRVGTGRMMAVGGVVGVQVIDWL
jgi:flagellar motor switch/type III secretory pathway protein FliN